MCIWSWSIPRKMGNCAFGRFTEEYLQTEILWWAQNEDLITQVPFWRRWLPLWNWSLVATLLDDGVLLWSWKSAMLCFCVSWIIQSPWHWRSNRLWPHDLLFKNLDFFRNLCRISHRCFKPRYTCFYQGIIFWPPNSYELICSCAPCNTRSLWFFFVASVKTGTFVPICLLSIFSWRYRSDNAIFPLNSWDVRESIPIAVHSCTQRELLAARNGCQRGLPFEKPNVQGYRNSGLLFYIRGIIPGIAIPLASWVWIKGFLPFSFVDVYRNRTSLLRVLFGQFSTA
jgi:hypothetical protein